MKTEIIQAYKPRDEYYIKSLVNLNSSTTVVFATKYKSPSFIDILKDGEVINSIDLSLTDNFDTRGYYNCLFAYKSGFGLFHYTNQFVLWREIESKVELINVVNPFKPDQADRKIKCSKAIYDPLIDKIIFSLDDYAHHGASPRFMSDVTLKDKNAVWGRLFELPKDKFPTTAFAKFLGNNDWLNIKEFVSKSGELLVHSTGGSSTRLKSGNPYEYSIVAKFDSEKRWLRNFTIEEGIGKFSTNNAHFILHPRKKKNRLVFYSSSDFQVEFDLSLTPKQNLGQLKNSSILTDLLEDKLFVYDHQLLNYCRLIK
jgi:hypothetical protein